MRKLLILGTGCPKCNKLTEITKEAADALGIEYDIEKVSDLQKIMSYGVMMTPALVVDGQVKVSGRVPSVEEIQKMIA